MSSMAWMMVWLLTPSELRFTPLVVITFVFFKNVIFIHLKCYTFQNLWGPLHLKKKSKCTFGSSNVCFLVLSSSIQQTIT